MDSGSENCPFCLIYDGRADASVIHADARAVAKGPPKARGAAIPSEHTLARTNRSGTASSRPGRPGPISVILGPALCGPPGNAHENSSAVSPNDPGDVDQRAEPRDGA